MMSHTQSGAQWTHWGRSVIVACALVALATCSGGGGGGGGSGGGSTGGGGTTCGTIGTGDIVVSWTENRETGVNATGGGYKVYYSTNSGFAITDLGVTEVDVPYVSGPTAPTTTTLTSLSPSTYYIKVVAYSTLNSSGSSPTGQICAAVQ